MKAIYKEGDRVEFMARVPKMTLNGNIINSKAYRQIVGYVKRVTKNWLGQTRYLICDTTKDSVRYLYVVKPSRIFGLVEKKEKGDKK